MQDVYVIRAGFVTVSYDADAVRYSLQFLLDHPADADWSFYYIARRAQNGAPATLIGAGGFKGSAGDTGTVEVGYSIVAEHRRQGYATEAVAAWVDFAFASPAVNTVIGQTLPSLAPSIGVLEKSGFEFDGTGYDAHAPEGEQVIRYVMSRERWKGLK